MVIADDSEAFRRRARELVDAAPGFQPVGETGSGEGAVELAATLRPDLLLIDVRMPGIGGLAAARRVAAVHPEGVVILVSAEGTTAVPPGAWGGAAAELLAKRDLSPESLSRLWREHGRP